MNSRLRSVLPKAQKKAGISKINQLMVAPSDKIFESVLINYFKNMGNKILKSLRVALLQPMTQIKDEKETTNNIYIP